MMDYSLEVCSVDRSVLEAAFTLNAKKVRICEIMSGGFTVKIQQCVKKSGSFWYLYLFVKIFTIWLVKSLTNCLKRGRQ